MRHVIYVPPDLTLRNVPLCIKTAFLYYLATSVVPKLFFSHEPSWLRKITIDPHTITHANKNYPYDGYPKLQMYISELI